MSQPQPARTFLALMIALAILGLAATAVLVIAPS